MRKRTVTRSLRPFTRSCRAWLLLSLPDNVTKQLFDSLSTKHAAILSSVNRQLRSFALTNTPASWHNISVSLTNADHIDTLLTFLSKLSTSAKSLALHIDSNAIDINDLQKFPLMPMVKRLILSRNGWLQCEHLELLAKRMPAVTHLQIDECLCLMDENETPPTDRFLEIVHRHYGPQLTVFSSAVAHYRHNGINAGGYNYAQNMMVSLMSAVSNVIAFNMFNNSVLCPNPVIAAMLKRNREIRKLVYPFILTDSEAPEVLMAMSSCRHLTHLRLAFTDASLPATPLKLSMLRAALSGLTDLKVLGLTLYNAPIEEEDTEDGCDLNLKFKLDHLAVDVRRKLHPFLRNLIFTQMDHLSCLDLSAPTCTDLFADLFAQPRPRLRQLMVGRVDYATALFTPPETGYRFLLDRIPTLEVLVALTKNRGPNENDTELLAVLAGAYPHCEVEIDSIECFENRLFSRVVEEFKLTN